MKVADGYIIADGRPVRGHAVSADGKTELFEGPYSGKADLYGVIVPGLTDAHTHCADAGVKVKPGMSLEELVAPPDGLKHRYLRETPRGRLIADMKTFDACAENNGICAYLDFREGGLEGCLMAREACGRGIVLGRPVSPVFDAEEVENILSVADGIALSSVSDMDPEYAEKVADLTKKAGKTFALHCSERIREDLDFVLSLQPDFLVHMVEATDPDLKRCADSDIPIAVCPRSNGYFGKIPPLKRMMETGNTVAFGTDNAMLCTPDLRPEAALSAEILGSDETSLGWIWHCMTVSGRKLLNHTREIIADNNRETEYAVLPLRGKTPEKSWMLTDPVTLI